MNKALRDKLIKSYGDSYKAYVVVLCALHEGALDFLDCQLDEFLNDLKVEGYIYWTGDSWNAVYPFYEAVNDVVQEDFRLISKLEDLGITNKKIQDSCKVAYRVLITTKGVKDAYKKLLKSHTEDQIVEACKEYYLRNIKMQGKPKTLLNYLESDCAMDITEIGDSDDYDPRFR